MIEIRGGKRKCSPQAILKLVGRTLPLMTGLQGLLGLSGFVMSSTTWLGLLLPSELYAATWRRMQMEQVTIYSRQSRARAPVCSQWMHRCKVHLVSDNKHRLNVTTNGGIGEWLMIRLQHTDTHQRFVIKSWECQHHKYWNQTGNKL